MISEIETDEKIPDNLVLWRYMDFASFYSLLYKKALYFRRIDRYSDQHEGKLPDEVKEYLFRTWSQFPLFGVDVANEMINQFSSHLEQFNTGTLSNSWVASNSEIYAMWKIYLRGSSEGIAIKSDVNRLIGSLSSNTVDLTLAKVKYEILPWSETWYKTLAAYKHISYSYENELRVLVYDQFEKDSIPIDVFPKVPLYDQGVAFPVDVDKLIEEIHISPFSGEWFNDVIKSTVQYFLPTFDLNKIKASRIKDK